MCFLAPSRSCGYLCIRWLMPLALGLFIQRAVHGVGSRILINCVNRVENIQTSLYRSSITNVGDRGLNSSKAKFSLRIKLVGISSYSSSATDMGAIMQFSSTQGFFWKGDSRPALISKIWSLCQSEASMARLCSVKPLISSYQQKCTSVTSPLPPVKCNNHYICDKLYRFIFLELTTYRYTFHWH